MTKEYNRLTVAKQFQVLKLIEANGERDAEFFRYADGWSDERIASDVGVPLQSVKYRRREVFGDIRPTRYASAPSPRIDDLETGLRVLRVATYQLTKRVESLEKALNVFITAGGSQSIPRDKLEELRRHFNGVVTPTPSTVE